MKKESFWAIAGMWQDGKPFLYCGTWLTRSDAIDEHCRQNGCEWAERRKVGDRAVKIAVTWRYPS